jgi:anti-anti-sigma regulatory factor
MATLTRLLQWEVEGDTLILTPLIDLPDREHQQIEEAKRDILLFLEKTATQNVIMDFRHTSNFWTTACRMFLKVRKEVRRRDGRMVFCNVSDQARKILRHPKLDGQWPICSSREKAIEATRGKRMLQESGA